MPYINSTLRFCPNNSVLHFPPPWLSFVTPPCNSDQQLTCDSAYCSASIFHTIILPCDSALQFCLTIPHINSTLWFLPQQYCPTLPTPMTLFRDSALQFWPAILTCDSALQFCLTIPHINSTLWFLPRNSVLHFPPPWLSFVTLPCNSDQQF
jgi:hypothetical protein